MLGQKNIRSLFKTAGIILLLLFLVLSVHAMKGAALYEQLLSFLQRPFLFVWLVFAYGCAFLLRAYAWRLYLLNRISIQQSLYGLFYSLFVNHITPLKIGDAVRVAVITKEKEVSVGEAAQSVIAMRMLDLLILGLFAGTGLLILFGNLSFNIPILVLGGVGGLGLFIFGHKLFPSFMKGQLNQLKHALRGKKGVAIFLLIAASWGMEAFVIYGVVHSPSFSFLDAIWVNSVTIAGQLFQLTPGGIGTYEAVMTFALQAVGLPLTDAYAFAVVSHGFKFLFSYGAGIILMLLYPIKLTTFLRKKGEKGK
ncbi:lysylphosphatidylglycerol synthase transmembrane domain-containing protein [Bacillus sp. 165]|uniref:lysylphosphatidylglycerol synthase transmembrane domain-containing protein n=1 Tax=Bacillus sp. 165 TaxID=1529117 RepID=UPI001AD9C2B0|nr:lysylphosphatidylglycerol synthase transmembrane domain-containing protein [Bacillus sp. 165]MBO9130569.1 flippase-like domain-containing protein [Bacillus sp. 165]